MTISAEFDADIRLAGRSLILVRFSERDISDKYISWLNDGDVNYYSRRHRHRFSKADARNYLMALPESHVILAIRHNREGHVGNIGIGPVDWPNRCCDIGILIGEKRVWGRGIAKEAIYLASRYLFEDLKLHRVEAGSANPAFVKAVTRLGWRVEGTQRDRVLIDGVWHSWTLTAQLEDEFHRNVEFE